MLSTPVMLLMTIFLMSSLVLLLFLLLRFTHFKAFLFNWLGWEELDEEKAILSPNTKTDKEAQLSGNSPTPLPSTTSHSSYQDIHPDTPTHTPLQASSSLTNTTNYLESAYSTIGTKVSTLFGSSVKPNISLPQKWETFGTNSSLLNYNSFTNSPDTNPTNNPTHSANSANSHHRNNTAQTTREIDKRQHEDSKTNQKTTTNTVNENPVQETSLVQKTNQIRLEDKNDSYGNPNSPKPFQRPLLESQAPRSPQRRPQPQNNPRSVSSSPLHDPLDVRRDRNRNRSSISSDDSFCDSDADQSSPRLQRAYSSESIDSNCSALELTHDNRDIGQLEVRLFYDRNSQMFHMWVLQAYDMKGGGGGEREFWVVLFLLPHPNPLWRTQLQVGPYNPRFHEEFKQCIRHRDVGKIALLCQMYCRLKESSEATLLGQSRLRLKDISLSQPNTLNLSLLPPSTEAEEEEVGEACVTLSYLPTAERLTIVLSKIRSLSPSPQHDNTQKVQCRAYLVCGTKVAKKKTSVKEVEGKGAHFNESMIFNLPQKNFNKVHVRLSFTEYHLNNTEVQNTLGYVTLGAKTSGKTLGHWQKIAEQPRKQVSMWHSIRPKKQT